METQLNGSRNIPDELMVRIIPESKSFLYSIWIATRKENGYEIHYQDYENGGLRSEFVKTGDGIGMTGPSLMLDDYMLSGLAEAIAQYGIKVPTENYMKGKLEATEKHLEDMRKIAKTL